jgi:hypothetical protein
MGLARTRLAYDQQCSRAAKLTMRAKLIKLLSRIDVHCGRVGAVKPPKALAKYDRIKQAASKGAPNCLPPHL